MALFADNYVAPEGDLVVAVLWPRLNGESENQRDDRALDDIEAYRLQAYSKTLVDDLTRHWVNYRAYQRFADVLNAIPASASNDEGSRAYTVQQAEYWAAKAAEELAEFEVATEVEGSTYGIITSYR